MTEEEARDYVAEAVREAVEGKAIGRDARTTIEALVVRQLKELVKLGSLARADNVAVTLFDELPEASRERVERLYEDLVSRGLGGSRADETLPLLEADRDDLRWIVEIRTAVPEGVQHALVEASTENGVVDWEHYQGLVEAHPDSFDFVQLRHPRGVVLVDADIELAYPIDINYIKLDITLGKG